jgi:SLT domain-containing protein
MIIDFFLKKLPGMIVDAVRDVFTPNVTGSVAFANGGVIGRNGPTLVGERGPEWLWGSRGQYVEANGGAGGRQIVINNNHAPFDLDRAIRQARMLAA